ncbi:AraC family transcriptional regulator [Roseivirga sp. E12]|uniref:helix-turn-helix domain-containing protein n=1 Tax=Roseivirga sp. E12 TaxID=2819237 RepID=UPI001ABBE531|nr:AraC family transcriptional regulator [Roseivirga sp. E12]MBO3697941.1 helix-turn-helix transcriptional regulator [Roseivirga sp. E12]
MTRDIIDINNFIVLIEHSSAEKTFVEKCGFESGVIGIAFYGKGEVELNIVKDNLKETYHNTKGAALSFYAGKGSTFEHTISPEQPMQSICIVSTLDNFKKLPEHEQKVYEEQLSELVVPKKDIVGGPAFYMTPHMQTAVEKIFSTTFTGNTRMMFLRSQVTELLAHFFAELDKPITDTLKNEDVEKIYEAKEILDSNISAPPSLNELSKLIGLNSNKLKKNFKEVFGMPVFKHLQNERLSQAHDMLKDSELSIQEAAWQVGYESLSSFSNAFTKKFGFRPSEIKR